MIRLRPLSEQQKFELGLWLALALCTIGLGVSLWFWK